MKIPFNKASISGNEFQYLQNAIETGALAGDGPYTKRCHAILEQLIGCKKALLTTSCTHALEMAAILLNIKPGDEVIVPSYTFVSTINAFVLRGAKPVFAEIRPDTLNIDENSLERLITPKTRAIVPVHYAGVACEMDAILSLADSKNIRVVEDNAHGLFGSYRGKKLGSLGVMATQSFHETKNISCGEGGALLINSSEFIERAEILREKGTNRSRFFRGQVDKYTWVDIGSSYLPSDLLAAFLTAQLENAEKIQARRKQIWQFYCQNLKHWATHHGVKLPFVPEYCEQAYHMFYLIMPDRNLRDALIAFLKADSISTAFHYVPLHSSDMGRSYGYNRGDLPVTEEVSDCLVRLPFYNSITNLELERVVEKVQNFFQTKQLAA